MRVYDSCGHQAKAYLQLDSLLPVLRGTSDDACVGSANSSRVLGKPDGTFCFVCHCRYAAASNSEP